MSNVRLDLAHHLGRKDAERLGLPAEDLRPGTTIVVREDVARGLIGAGYAQVDTEDPRAAATALRRHAPKDHPLGVFREPEPEQSGAKEAPELATNAEPSEGTAAAPKRGSGSGKA